jgi:excisionase family DNA binding protein
MNHQILLNGISVDELIARLKSELTPVAPATPKETTEDFLTAKQVSKLLGISLVTLHKWKKDGKLKFHRFGTRIRFQKSEILNNEKFSNKGK